MPADEKRIDTLIQYALLLAGTEEERTHRDLGPIHLIKYVYLADLAYAERNDGQTFTGIEWQFHKFGPWSQTVNARIAPALASIGGADERSFPSDYGDGEDRLDEDRLKEWEKAVPPVIAMALPHSVRRRRRLVGQERRTYFVSRCIDRRVPSSCDQVPYTFEPVVKVSPLKVDQPLKQTDLPVAAMALHHGETWAAYRAKKRPCIVVGMPGAKVDKALVRGAANSATAPTMLVVPSYGVQRNANRAGYPPEFVERVRHLEYAQFLWDKFPESDDTPESIVRLDHLQPVVTHYASFKVTGWKLGGDALSVVDDLLSILMRGGIDEDSLVNVYREWNSRGQSLGRICRRWACPSRGSID